MFTRQISRASILRRYIWVLPWFLAVRLHSLQEAYDHHLFGHPGYLHEHYFDHRDEFLGEDPPSIRKRHHLLGDWAGLRKEADARGIHLLASYGNDIQFNPVGGDRHGWANASSFYLGAHVDLCQLMGLWPGLSLFVSTIYRSGQNLSGDIGNAFNVAQLFGGSTIWLDEIYLHRKFCYRDAEFKIGRLDAEVDFAYSHLMAYYVSLAINANPIAIWFDTPLPTDPWSTWGAFLKFSFSPRLRLRFGLYNGNLEIRQNRFHGVNWTFDHPDGIMFITEAEYHRYFQCLAGSYKFGGYYITGRHQRFGGGQRVANHGYYWVIDQMLLRSGNRHLSTWFSGLFTPADRNLLPIYLALGLVGKGVIGCRPKDVACLGLVYGKFSDELRSAVESVTAAGFIGPFGAIPQTFESLVELNYWIHVSPWLYITPVLQYVGNPSGFGFIPHALVVGVQIGVIL